MAVKMALRVMELMELFARERRPLALSEVARLMGTPVSSCLGLLRTLGETGYLYETGPRQGYYPTGRLLQLAQVIARHDPVADRVRPALEELSATVRETVVFGKLRDLSQVLYLEVVHAPQSIRYVTQAGELRPSSVNSLGRALLSALPPQRRLAVLRAIEWPRLTPHTRTTPEAIALDIEQSLARGWFANQGESIADLTGLAWPLRLGGETYAISIAGPAYRIDPHIEEWAAVLRAACAAVERSAQPATPSPLVEESPA